MSFRVFFGGRQFRGIWLRFLAKTGPPKGARGRKRRREANGKRKNDKIGDFEDESAPTRAFRAAREDDEKQIL